MSTQKPGFQSFFIGFLHHFVFAKLTTSSIRVEWGVGGGPGSDETPSWAERTIGGFLLIT